MTDNNDDKTLHVTGKKTLTLKPSGLTQGTVRQDMGRGRTKAVVVETRKRRPGGRDDDKPVVPIQTRPQPHVAQQPSRVHVEQRRPESQRPAGNVLNELSPSEIEARRRAL
ncbi:MAG: IF-2-associated domain-containing protein, partial [Rhizobiaceae bacterium]|nr:IF-2-associated domain-containing protein [Rhizobiaceae bacterium]